jgi:ABC-type multidrug transport system fused ATPase/permease subunit
MENLKITQDEGVASDYKEDNDGKKTVLLSDSIEVKDVSYRYPTGDKAVFSEADMIIKKGTSVGIVGASGAGKTTAIDLVLGLLTPDQGKITVDGTDIQKFYKDWISQIGYIPQSIFLLDSDIRENVAFGVPTDDIDDDKVWHALKEAALEEHVRSLPDGLFTEIGERGIRLSGGQRQRLGIARALYFDPEVIVFDEATSALDNDTENAIMESIDHLQGSKTLIIIAHRLSTIENCDAVYCVEDGKIVRQR